MDADAICGRLPVEVVAMTINATTVTAGNRRSRAIIWYASPAARMYRAGLEWILGFRMSGATLQIDPCIPKAWSGFEVRLRYKSASYSISVENPRGVSRGVAHVELDDVVLAANAGHVPLGDDGANHRVRLLMG